MQKLVLDCNVFRWHNRRHERSVKLPNNMAKRFKHTHKHACTNPSSTTKPMRMFYTQITSQQQQNTEKIKSNDTGAATCSAGHPTYHFFAYVTADITQYHRLLHLPKARPGWLVSQITAPAQGKTRLDTITDYCTCPRQDQAGYYHRLLHLPKARPGWILSQITAPAQGKTRLASITDYCTGPRQDQAGYYRRLLHLP